MMKSIKFIMFLALMLGTKLSFGQSIDSLYSAMQKDDVLKISKMVTKKNIDSCISGSSFLAAAIRMQAKKSFDFLLKSGANPNGFCDGNKSVILLATKYGDLEMFKKLVAKGAKLGIKYGELSLKDYAMKYGKQDIVDYLVSLK